MPYLTANRILVKSPPELWSELSEVESLARHLGEFGEISISRLEPEHTVAWEGEHARGTVELEASGWGTRVTLSAQLPEAAPDQQHDDPADEALVDQPAADKPADEPIAGGSAVAESARREWWLRRWLFRQRHVDDEPVAIVQEAPARLDPVDPQPLAWYDPDPGDPEVAEESLAVSSGRAQSVLEQILDDLGSAHHRPFSRQG